MLEHGANHPLRQPLAAVRRIDDDVAEVGVRREIGDGFIEVYVNASLGTCISRDPKGLYNKALAGAITAFTGVSDQNWLDWCRCKPVSSGVPG